MQKEQQRKLTFGVLVTGIAVASLLSGSAVLAADRVVVIPLGGSSSPQGILGQNKGVSIGAVVTGSDGTQQWLDRNLGASQVATSSTDSLAYGDLYQWGRGVDGHESRTSPTTDILSPSDSPGHDNFIIISGVPYDWRSPQNKNLWQGFSGINNPCPAGFRLPTETEWETERTSWTGGNNSAGAYASPLKLVAAGDRFSYNGDVFRVNEYGYYWSSTVNGSESRSLRFYATDASMRSVYRASGFSVRCIKD